MGVVLYFVRHGETDWNRQGRLQGQQDTPLNALGRAQAEEVGQRLAALAKPESLDYVASPMARTRETMERLRQAAGLDPGGYRTDPRLVELTFGAWEGLTWREVRRLHPGPARQREADKWGFVPPGGESYAMLAHRVLPAARELASHTVIVAHGGVARALLAGLCGVDKAAAPRLDIWHGRVLVIERGAYRWV